MNEVPTKEELDRITLALRAMETEIKSSIKRRIPDAYASETAFPEEPPQYEDNPAYDAARGAYDELYARYRQALELGAKAEASAVLGWAIAFGLLLVLTVCLWGSLQ